LPSVTPQGRRRQLRPDADGAGFFGVGALGDDAQDDVLGSAGSMIDCRLAAILTPQIRDEGPPRVRPTVCRQFNRRQDQ
jgi:hypothetical protein